MVCPTCNGIRQVDERACPACSGTGRTWGTLEVVLIKTLLFLLLSVAFVILLRVDSQTGSNTQKLEGLLLVVALALFVSIMSDAYKAIRRQFQR